MRVGTHIWAVFCLLIYFLSFSIKADDTLDAPASVPEAELPDTLNLDPPPQNETTSQTPTPVPPTSPTQTPPQADPVAEVPPLDQSAQPVINADQIPDDQKLSTPNPQLDENELEEFKTTKPVAPTEVTSDAIPDQPEDYNADIPGRVEFNPRIPRFRAKRPKWAFQLQGTHSAFSGEAQDQLDKRIGFSFIGEYLPTFIQDIGVFSLGATLTLFPSTTQAELSRNFLSLWSFGAQARYQARFFREQPVVPLIGFAYDFTFYNLANGAQGNLPISSLFYGLMIYLNMFEQKGASDFYVNYKALRSYLVVELRQALSAQNSDLNLSSLKTYYFGFRIEFE